MKEKITNSEESLQQRLDLLIEMKGLNKSALARMAGVRPQAVTKWYDRGDIGKSSAMKIAAATGVSVDWILEGGPEMHQLNQHRAQRLASWFLDKELPEKEAPLFKSLMRGETSFTEKVARRIEKDYSLPTNYLDAGALIGQSGGELTQMDKDLLYHFHRLTMASREKFLNEIKEKADYYAEMFDELSKLKNL